MYEEITRPEPKSTEELPARLWLPCTSRRASSSRPWVVKFGDYTWAVRLSRTLFRFGTLPLFPLLIYPRERSIKFHVCLLKMSACRYKARHNRYLHAPRIRNRQPVSRSSRKSRDDNHRKFDANGTKNQHLENISIQKRAFDHLRHSFSLVRCVV